MSNSEHMAKTIKAHCETLTNHDKEGWLSLWADDAVLEDPAGVDIYEGLDAIGTTFWDLVDGLSPMKLWLDRNVIICGNEAIAILFGVVSQNGVLTKVGPIVDLFTFNDDGKIKSMRAFWKYQ